MLNPKYGRERMKRIYFFCLLIAFLSALNTAIAGTKEDLMRLQSDVLQLSERVLKFDKDLNEKIDGLKSLVVQLNDQVAKSNVLLGKVSATLDNQASGVRTSDQTLLQEIRALSSKVDDSATRISALAQQVADLKVQSKPIQEKNDGQSSGISEALYSQADQDFRQGNFDLAVEGFKNYLENSPTGIMAPAAQLNIGEVFFSQNKLPQAIAAFTRVIEAYPNSDKVPPALYKRGIAKLAIKQTEDAIADFKSITKMFPTSTESDLANYKLQELEIGTTKAKSKQPSRKTR
jgi:tol-pal system protein YbgF